MRKTLLLCTLLVSSMSFASDEQLTLNQMKQQMEFVTIKAKDWYKQGDAWFAKINNQGRKVEVTLAGDRAYYSTTLMPNDRFDVYGAMACQKLANNIPHTKAKSWSEPYTPEQEYIQSIFTSDVNIDSHNQGELNGWTLEIKRGFDYVECSVQKQSS